MDFQLPEQLWQIIATVTGGLISALAGYLTQKLSERRSKNELLMTRLEEIYGLCQALYDNHQDRISWLLSHEQVTADNFKNGPKHPGYVMSEVKMKVRSYAANLQDSLESMDEGHQKLKAFFGDLEARALSGDILRKGSDYTALELDQHLETLGHGADAVKLGAVTKLKKYFS